MTTHSTSAEDKDVWSRTSALPLCLHGVDEDKFTFLFDLGPNISVYDFVLRVYVVADRNFPRPYPLTDAFRSFHHSLQTGAYIAPYGRSPPLACYNLRNLVLTCYPAIFLLWFVIGCIF